MNYPLLIMTLFNNENVIHVLPQILLIKQQLLVLQLTSVPH